MKRRGIAQSGVPHKYTSTINVFFFSFFSTVSSRSSPLPVAVICAMFQKTHWIWYLLIFVKLSVQRTRACGCARERSKRSEEENYINPSQQVTALSRKSNKVKEEEPKMYYVKKKLRGFGFLIFFLLLFNNFFFLFCLLVSKLRVRSDSDHLISSFRLPTEMRRDGANRRKKSTVRNATEKECWAELMDITHTEICLCIKKMDNGASFEMVSSYFFSSILYIISKPFLDVRIWIEFMFVARNFLGS